jgi:hypothetical protein
MQDHQVQRQHRENEQIEKDPEEQQSEPQERRLNARQAAGFDSPALTIIIDAAIVNPVLLAFRGNGCTAQTRIKLFRRVVRSSSD